MKDTFAKIKNINKNVTPELLKEAFSLMCTAKALSEIYEDNRETTSKYVHATSVVTKQFK